MSLEDTLKQNKDLVLVLNSECKKVRIDPFVFDLPIFCIPLGNGFYRVETDLVFNNGEMKKIRFPQAKITISERGLDIKLGGDPIFELIEGVPNGRVYCKGE